MPKAGKQITDPDDGSRYTVIHTKTMRVLIGLGAWTGLMLTALLVLVAIELGHNDRQDTRLTDLTFKTARLQQQEAENNFANCERNNESRVASIKEKRQNVRTLRKTLHLWRAAIKAAPPGELEGNPISPLFIAYVKSLEEELATKLEGIRSTIESQAEVAVKPGAVKINCSLAFNKGGNHG